MPTPIEATGHIGRNNICLRDVRQRWPHAGGRSLDQERHSAAEM